MKKRFLIVLFTMTITMSLCACNKNTNETVSNDVKNPPTEIETTTQEESSTETETTTQEESSTEIETTTQEESSTEIESNLESNTEIDSSKTENTESTKFTTTPLDTTMYATQQCNIRSNPSTEDTVIGSLLQTQEIHVTGKVNEVNWYEVSLADGSTGYISGGLLTDTKPTVQIETPAPTTQQEAASQSEELLTPDQVINPDTGEPIKDGDVLPNGLIHQDNHNYDPSEWEYTY